MKCPKCGSEILKGHRYCSSCDYEMTAEDWQEAQRSQSSGSGSKATLVGLAALLVLGALAVLFFINPFGGGKAPAPTTAPTQTATVRPTTKPTDAPTPRPTPTPEPAALLPAVRSEDDMVLILRDMQMNGESRREFSDNFLTDDQMKSAVQDCAGIQYYTYGSRLGSDYIEVQWYPGVRIWHAQMNGDTASLSAEDQQILQQAQAVVNNLIRPTMTELEKVRTLHDYIIYNCDYLIDPEGLDTASVYGFFRHGRMQCAGYMDTFYLLGSMSGLDVACMSGTIIEDNESHAWNLVRINSMWYALDVTWDDPTGGADENWLHMNIPHNVFNGLRIWNPMFMPNGGYAQQLDANWYYYNLPRASSVDAAVQAAIAQLNTGRTALVYMDAPGISIDAISKTLADHYQLTIWKSYLTDEPWATIYKFSFDENG